jgi:hypothetical protein
LEALVGDAMKLDNNSRYWIVAGLIAIAASLLAFIVWTVSNSSTDTTWGTGDLQRFDSQSDKIRQDVQTRGW